MHLNLKANIYQLNNVRKIACYSFDETGGLIGRDACCQMVLDDALCKISKIQAEIKFREGHFYIYNLGVEHSIYLNGDELRFGECALLNPQSVFQVGEYTIAVEQTNDPVENNAAFQAWFDDPLNHLPSPKEAKCPSKVEGLYDEMIPFSDLISGELHQASGLESGCGFLKNSSSIPEDFNPLCLPSSSENLVDPLLHLEPEGGEASIQAASIDAIFNDGDEDVEAYFLEKFLSRAHDLSGQFEISRDPLELFGDENKNSCIDWGPSLKNTQVIQDHAAEINTYFKAPQAYIPDPHTPAEKEKEVSTLSEAALFHSSNKLDELDECRQLSGYGVGDSTAEEGCGCHASADGLHEAPTVLSCDTMDDHAGDIQAELPKAFIEELEDTDTPKSGLEDADALLKSFKKGAHLEHCTYPEQMTPELMYLIGALLEKSIKGGMDLLRHRASKLHETQRSLELTGTEENNLLKAASSMDAVFAQIFSPPIAGVPSAIDSIENALEHLKSHELALWAGTQATIDGVFELLSPQSIEEKSHVASRFKIYKHARLWEMYCARYAWLQETFDGKTPTSGRDFFNQAYASACLKNHKDASPSDSE